MSGSTSGSDACVQYAADGGVATIKLSQPSKLNAMTYEMWASLPAHINRAENDPKVRLIVVRGEGSRAFCAGADISQFGELRDSKEAVRAYDIAVAEGSKSLAGAAKPTVAAISGICFGGGFALSICCDLRIASADARFRIPAARLGLGYSFDGVELIAQKIGMSKTADLLMSARIVDAVEAQGMGIVNALFPVGEFEDGVKAYTGRIAANAPITLRAVKAALVEIAKPSEFRNVGRVDALVAECFDSLDYKEGRTAFAQKRDPVFNGN